MYRGRLKVSSSPRVYFVIVIVIVNEIVHRERSFHSFHGYDEKKKWWKIIS